jgi:hypothetical protein
MCFRVLLGNEAAALLNIFPKDPVIKVASSFADINYR